MATVWRTSGVPTLCRIRMEHALETQISLDDGRQERILDMAGKAHALYRLGQWMAEIFMPDRAAPYLELTLLRTASASGKMSVDFMRNVGAATITLLDLTPESRRFQNVSRVEIDSDAIRVDAGEISDASNEKRVDFENIPPRRSDTPPESATARRSDTPPESATARGGNTVRESAEMRRMEQEFRQVKEALDNAERELSQRNASLTRTEQELSQTRTALAKAEQDLDAERRYNARLQITADGHLEEFLANLEREKEHLDRALKEKLSETEALSEKVRETNRKLSQQTAEAERLNQELENSFSLLELKTLDCEQTRQTLDSLRERSLSDEDTLELMRTEPFLKGNSVRKTLETVERELDAAETRMGRIIRLREKINNVVQAAILVGNGTIPLSEELGGNRNGGDRPTPEQGSEHGTGFERGREPSGTSAAGD